MFAYQSGDFTSGTADISLYPAITISPQHHFLPELLCFWWPRSATSGPSDKLHATVGKMVVYARRWGRNRVDFWTDRESVRLSQDHARDIWWSENPAVT